MPSTRILPLPGTEPPVPCVAGVDPELPLWIASAGRPRGPDTETFLLLHGYGGSSFSFRHWASHLAGRGHVLMVDMKGFGRAPKPDDGLYGPGDLAAVVTRYVLREGLQRLTLVGHSLGGGVALHVALSLRDEGRHHTLERLVLMAGAAYMQPLPPFVALARHPRFTRVLLRALGPRVVVGQALRTIVFDPTTVTGGQIRAYAEPMAGEAAERALLDAARQIVPPDLGALTARYGEITAPTLLLWGRQDRAVPLWVGERLASALPAARLHVLERCGHLPAEERPGPSLAALRAFLDVTP